MSPKTLNLGLLLLPGFQWLDAAGPVDYLNNHSHAEIEKLIPLGEDKSMLDKAPYMNWHYISNDLSPVHATSGPPQVPTCTYGNCPPLDYLIVPGPDLTTPLPEGCAFAAVVCTGSLAITPTGILDGLNVCSNKYALRALAKAGMLYRKVKWVGDRRWIVDGKVWSSAGITAGLDLAAEFARVHFDPALVQLGKDLSEYTPLPAQPDAFARLLEGVDLP
ncbi:class I glutamine amidotransferase-like protein [Flammula alnicola]|nr:class I glutamine amidotransferase-like protein [Flammula alnicola]